MLTAESSSGTYLYPINAWRKTGNPHEDQWGNRTPLCREKHQWKPPETETKWDFPFVSLPRYAVFLLTALPSWQP